MENKYIIYNMHLKDESLSWGAKGLLTYLLTLPEDHKINISELANHTKDGVTKTSTLIKELIEAGYIKRRQLKTKTGTFTGYKYSILQINF